MDRILVFDRGNIVADGTHKSLLARSQLYKELWNAQVGAFYLKKRLSARGLVHQRRQATLA